MARTILIIDDEESIRTALKGALEDEGFDVLLAEDGTSGISVASDELPDLVLLDIWMPGIDGIETLNRLKRILPKLPVVIMSGHGTIEVAVRATKLGAYDFIEKPLSLEKVMITIRHALETSMLEQENLILKGDERHMLIGETGAMSRLKEEIKEAASSGSGVLVAGEEGTGKEVVAWNIHNLSDRANKPFVAVNCSAIPEELLESELFGYEKGAFTGATSHKKGKLDMAHEGTLFLDEISAIPPATQERLARLIEKHIFNRVGGSKPVKVDVRVIASTNGRMSEVVGQGGAILSGLSVRLQIPPLRERVEDIPLFVEHFMNEFSRKSARPVKKVSAEAMNLLRGYGWPGNVRELRNLIERVAIMVQSDTIEPVHLPQEMQLPEELPGGSLFSPSGLKEAMTLFEREFILKKLEENGWGISETAKAIGVDKSYLMKKINAYEIGGKE